MNGNGGGGAGNGGADSATSTARPATRCSSPPTRSRATNAANRDYAQPVYAALDGAVHRGVERLRRRRERRARRSSTRRTRSTPTYDDATGGNVVQVARVDLKNNGKGDARARLRRHAGRGGRRRGGLARPRTFDRRAPALPRGLARLRQDAEQAAAQAARPARRKDVHALEDAYYLSANVLKASEDKTFPGAIVASLASPWGQAVSAGDPANTYFGSYREVFARDLYEAWTGLVADGDLATARDATLFLFDRQQLPDGSMPRNSLVNGKTAPDSFGTQLDEVRVPDPDGATSSGSPTRSLYDEPRQAGGELRRRARAVVRRPSAGRSRAATRRRRSRPRSPASSPRPTSRSVNGDTTSADVWLGVADDFQRSIKGWTVTTNGPLAPRVLHPALEDAATRTRRSPTTSATAGRRSTSAR